MHRRLNLPMSNARSASNSRAASYRVNDWLEDFKCHRSGVLKQVGYAALWPLLHLEARRWLSEATLEVYSPVAIFRDRGFPIESRRRWALSGLDVSNLVILVQGDRIGMGRVDLGPPPAEADHRHGSLRLRCLARGLPIR